jgi:hypothetical protein
MLSATHTRHAHRLANEVATDVQNQIRAGWRRSADRTYLQPNSLQTGNFSGNFAKFSPEETIVMQETPESQGLLPTSLPKLTGKLSWRTGTLVG